MNARSCNFQKPTYLEIHSVIEQWALQASRHATHALTLTFDGGSIARYIKRSATIQEANDPRMIERYRNSMRWFRALLNKRLYGNKSQRLGEQILLIPVIEGLAPGQNPHYHCLLGVKHDRFRVVEQAVSDCWSRVDFAGKHNTTVQIYDQGYSRYITKHAKALDKDSVDWLNVSMPIWSRPTAE